MAFGAAITRLDFKAGKLVFASLLLLSLLTACASRSHPAQVKMSHAQLKTATAEQLIARIDADASRIQTLNATVEMKASTGGSKKGKITEYESIRGYILVRKPGMLRMIGLFPVLRNRAFDMASNGNTFELWIPTKNKFITGSNEVSQPSKQPLENLRPQHIYDALLLHPVDPQKEIAVLEQGYATVANQKNNTQVIQPEYVLNIIHHGDQGWYLGRKIYFDRTDLQLYRQVVYDKNGYVATDVRYSDDKDFQGTEFPSQVSMWRPQEEYSVDISIEKLTINAPLSDSQFALARPPNAQIVHLDNSSSGQTGEVR